MSVKVIGLDRITKRLQGLPKGATQAVNASLLASATQIRNEAVSRVPIDEGLLKNSIKAQAAQDGNGATVSVNVNYGAYVEFGTGKKVNKALVNRYPDAAARAQNLPKSGNYKDFLESIAEWVRRKGIVDTYDIRSRGVKTRAGKRNARRGKAYNERLEGAVYLIAKSIMKNGIKSQPYFFPAYEREQKNIAKDAGRALSNYLRRG